MPQQQESDNVAIVVTDLEGNVRHRSGQVEELIGCPPLTDADASPFPAWFSAASRIDALEMLAECLNRGWSAEHQLICRHSDGHEFPLWVECSLVTDSAGQPANITWLLRETESQQHLQAALAESKEKYRHLFETSPSGVTLLSLTGEVIDCNPTTAAIAGFSREELIGRSFLELLTIPTGDRNQLNSLFSEVLSSDVSNHFEVQILRGGSEPRWTENFTSILHSEGKPYAVQVITRDITERRRMEKALRDSEARFRELADLLPQTVFEMEAGGRLTYVNYEALRQFGYSQADFDTGLSALQMFVPENRERLVENIQLRLQKKIAAGQGYTALRKDGTTFPARTYTSFITRDEEVVGLRGLVFDMTEVQLAAEQVRESEERFRTIAESMPLAVIITRPEDGIFLYANSKFKQEYGFSDESIASMRTLDYFARPEDRRHMLKVIEREGQLKDYEIDVIRGDGTPMTIRVAVTPVIYAGKSAMLSVLEDITARKQAELALRESERRYRELQDNIPIGIFQSTPDGKILFVNREALKITGYDSTDEFSNMAAFGNYFNPQKRDEFVQQLRQQGFVANFEAEFKRKDGAIIWANLQARAVYDSEGNLDYFDGTFVDVTERRAAEAAERQAREQLSATLDALPDLLFEVDREGRIYSWHSSNPEELYVPPERFMGKTMS
ncbi:MAG: PAS domain S-box protein, partial [bacterium]